jgi:three-Cys-motif partner protein
MVGDDDALQAQLLSEIGPWSEVKLEIIRKYAQAYSTIFNASNQQNLYHVYIDAFAGAGRHFSRASGAIVPGSPQIALST